MQLGQCTVAHGFHLLRGIASLLVIGTSWAVAPAAFAADCPDSDGDGFAVCDGCTLPAGKVCGDCDDANAAIRPGAQERCDDAVDNDCDGEINGGFAVGESCAFCDGPDCTATFCIASGSGENCSTMTGAVCKSPGGGIVCDSDGATMACAPGPTPKEMYQPEGVGVGSAANLLEATCGDLQDNDCDGAIDRADPECTLDAEILCDGLDDDGDGLVDETFLLGAFCSFGQGLCYDAGVTICIADQSGTECSVEAFAATPEEDPDGVACSDGVDNDCDGLADVYDPGCQTDEVCDGADNDGDDEVDEGFADLGDPCTVGSNACQATGVRICSPDGGGTECDATPLAPTREGPFGLSCRDGDDNDCDGLIDGADPDCLDPSAARVGCALVPLRRASTSDPTSCEGQFGW